MLNNRHHLEHALDVEIRKNSIKSACQLIELVKEDLDASLASCDGKGVSLFSLSLKQATDEIAKQFSRNCIQQVRI